MTAYLRRQGHKVNHKRVQRLMQLMGLEAISPKPNTRKLAPGHKIFPYLLRGLAITRPNQVWSSDITYIPMARGFMYLTAVIDWHSQLVVLTKGSTIRLAHLIAGHENVSVYDGSLMEWMGEGLPLAESSSAQKNCGPILNDRQPS